MSSILKALRKVEDEKAAIGEGGVDLAHDILKRSYDEPKKFPWLLIVCSGVLLILAVGSLLWWLQRTPPVEPVVVTAPPAAAVPAEPLKLQVAESQAVVSKAEVVALEKDVPLVIAPLDKSQEVASSAERTEVKTSVEQPVVEIPVLFLDEIVFHQDPASRLAVVNDLPVMVGTDIEGVRVEEILSDRVLFSYRGRHFEKRLKSE